jgi:hypothetical protein
MDAVSKPAPVAAQPQAAIQMSTSPRNAKFAVQGLEVFTRFVTLQML